MNKKKKKQTFVVLIFILSMLLILSIYQLLTVLYENSVGSALNNRLSQYVIYNPPATTDAPTDNSSKKIEQPTGDTGIDVNFSSLAQENKDICAWLISPDTVINYPVVQCNDNQYYLTHSFLRSKHKYGTLFVDAGNDPSFTDSNTIIYGHRMNDGAMFGSLLEYANPDYFSAHPYMHLFTPAKYYRIDIFAAYDVMLNSQYTTKNFDSEHEFKEFIDSAKASSYIQTNTTVKSTDKIVTFSTCSAHSDDKRFIILGKLIELDPPFAD